jgi:hypothetical protein
MMKAQSAVATLAVVMSAFAAQSACAQPQQMAPVAAPPAAVETQKPAAVAKARRWLKADARVCLEFPTDLQVIACSEKYR